jgi:hypothetical protein
MTKGRLPCGLFRRVCYSTKGFKGFIILRRRVVYCTDCFKGSIILCLVVNFCASLLRRIDVRGSHIDFLHFFSCIGVCYE